MTEPIKVTIWNEFRHELEKENVRRIYPDGLHKAIGRQISSPALSLAYATLDEPEHGLSEERLAQTDVLLWWGHCAHAEVRDEIVERVQRRALAGMGLIVLHSGHFSKIFKKLMGTDCSLLWRDCAEKERVWTVSPGHPIAKDVPASFVIPHTEMYGEHFGIPQDGEIIFMSWYEGGNVFRSGVSFLRGAGRIFYFSPGHETFPIYYDPVVSRIISNAVHWAAPSHYLPPRTTHSPAAVEEIRSTAEA